MNKIALLILAIVCIIIVVSVIYFMHSDTKSLVSLVYSGESDVTLYTGAKAPPYSSDGIDRIVFGKSNGTFEYNTDTKITKMLSSKVPQGLAYDGTYFMMLDQQGTLYQIDQQGSLTSTESGYTKLYDTIDGYLLSTGKDTAVSGSSGSTKPNTGNYGLVLIRLE